MKKVVLEGKVDISRETGVLLRTPTQALCAGALIHAGFESREVRITVEVIPVVEARKRALERVVKVAQELVDEPTPAAKSKGHVYQARKTALFLALKALEALPE